MTLQSSIIKLQGRHLRGFIDFLNSQPSTVFGGTEALTGSAWATYSGLCLENGKPSWHE